MVCIGICYISINLLLPLISIYFIVLLFLLILRVNDTNALYQNKFEYKNKI